ncbi:MAG: hypothetical protein ACLTSZ_04445 [Lachnospiraceae bacterium]
MAARIFYQKDCNLSLLEGKKIAIIGLWKSGHAHALNLKGVRMQCNHRSVRGSKSWAKAEAQGFQCIYSSRSCKESRYHHDPDQR